MQFMNKHKNKLNIAVKALTVAALFAATVFGQGNGKKVQVVFDGEVKKPVHIVVISGEDFFSVREIAQA